MFPLNGSSFFRVPPFATPWLPSVSVHHFSIATMKALRLLRFFTPTCFGGLWSLTAVASLGFIRSRFDAPALRLDVVFRCRPCPVLFSAENWRHPKFTGFPFHAPLPWPWTPVGRSAAWPFYVVRRLTLGPRWVNGADSSQLKLSWLVPTALVLAVNASCRPHRRLRMTRFRLRGSTLFPGRISTYWAPSQSFSFTSFCLHVLVSSLSVFILAQ